MRIDIDLRMVDRCCFVFKNLKTIFDNTDFRNAENGLKLRLGQFNLPAGSGRQRLEILPETSGHYNIKPREHRPTVAILAPLFSLSPFRYP